MPSLKGNWPNSKADMGDFIDNYRDDEKLIQARERAAERAGFWRGANFGFWLGLVAGLAFGAINHIRF